MSLTGRVINRGYLSLLGKPRMIKYSGTSGATSGLNGSNDLSELNHIKQYLNDTFVQPLLTRDLKSIKNNQYNFTYLNEELKKYQKSSPEEVNLYLQIVRFAQESVVILQKNAELEEKMMGEMMMGIITHIPSIILKPEFEIYKSFFGIPPNGKFDIEALKTVKNILKNNLGSNYNIIENLLLQIYKKPQKEKVGNFTFATPYRNEKNKWKEQRNHFLGNGYTLD